MTGVTRALEVIERGFRDMPEEKRIVGMEMGRDVHSFCLGWVKMGAGFGLPVPEDIAPYLEQFKQWFSGSVESVLRTEFSVEHRVWRYRGRVDLIAKLKGDRRFSVIDLKKTAFSDRVTGFQLAAYKRAAERKLRRNLGRRISLNLTDNRLPFAQDFEDDKTDFEGFIHALQLHKILRGGDKNGK